MYPIPLYKWALDRILGIASISRLWMQTSRLNDHVHFLCSTAVVIPNVNIESSFPRVHLTNFTLANFDRCHRATREAEDHCNTKHYKLSCRVRQAF